MLPPAPQVEEAAGDWDAAAAFLSRGAAFVTSPTQVQTLNTSVVEFEKRREASSGKAIDGMLLEATELGAAPSDTSSSAPSAPTPAVSLLAKTEGYAAAAPAAVSTVPVLPFHGLSDVVSRARAQISKASATLNQTSFVAAAPASTTASASAPAPTSPASPAVPVMAATATAALDPDTLAMPSPAPRPKSARLSSVAGSARRVSIGAQRVSVGPQRVSAPASPDELHMYLGLADSGDESELESDAGTPYIRRQMSGKTGYGPPTPASSLRHSVTKPNPSTSSSVGGAGRVSAGGADSRSELLAGLDGSMTMLHAKVAELKSGGAPKLTEKLAGATDGAPAPVALATIVSGRELLAKDREPPKEAALDPSADAPLAPAPSPMKGGALRVNKRRSSLTPSGIQGQVLCESLVVFISAALPSLPTYCPRIPPPQLPYAIFAAARAVRRLPKRLGLSEQAPGQTAACYRLRRLPLQPLETPGHRRTAGESPLCVAVALLLWDTRGENRRTFLVWFLLDMRRRCTSPRNASVASRKSNLVRALRTRINCACFENKKSQEIQVHCWA